MNTLINPSAVDVVNFIAQVLIANAQRGLTASVSMLPIQAVAQIVVNGNATIPLVTMDTSTTNG